MKKGFLFLLGLLFLLSSSEGDPEIRVRILKGKRSAYLYISQNLILESPNEKFFLPHFKGWIKAEEKEIRVGRRWRGEWISFSPRNKLFRLGRKLYRGRIVFYGKKSRLEAINILDIEDYLKGVIKGEISPHWPMEALKAQVVASRSFSLYSLNPRKEYDLEADESSQVYGGVFWEEESINKAVKATQGEVLMYQGQVIPAYFSACCGGYTEWANWVWEKAPDYIKGVECPFCKDSPYYHWEEDVSKREIARRLGLKVGRIKKIEIESLTPSGRVKKLKIVGEKGEELIEATLLREKLGTNRIKSTYFLIREGKYKVKFVGKGWGHGVGLCQWGMKKMAEEGYTYQEILKFYYPFAEIKKYED